MNHKLIFDIIKVDLREKKKKLVFILKKKKNNKLVIPIKINKHDLKREILRNTFSSVINLVLVRIKLKFHK